MSQDVAAAAITLQSKSYLIISLYNPPKQSPARLLTGIEGNFSSNHLTSTILGGDLNCYSPLWGPSQSKHGEIFEGFALQNDLLCINPPDHDPTFVGHNGSSHIDATFVSSKIADNITYWELLPIDIFEGLDHRPILFKLTTDPLPPPQPGNFDFKKISKSHYRTLIETHLPPLLEKWNQMNLSSTEQIDGAVKELSQLIYSLATQSCTLKHPITSKSWWSSELEQLQRDMKITRRRHTRLKSLQSKQIFLTARSNFTSALRKAKANFFKTKAENMDNPWKLYKFLGKKRHHHKHITLSDENGNPIALDPNLNASTLLDRFFPDDSPKEDLHHTTVRFKVRDFLRKQPIKHLIAKISSTEVSTSFLSLSPFSSPAQTKFLRLSLDYLSTPLALLFQSCLSCSYFPDAWKAGVLLTIPKADYPDASSHKSQRPITLLSVLGKGFEKVLLERFLHLKDSHNSSWFHRSQFGFRKNHSTDLALLSLKTQLEKDRTFGTATALLKLDIQSAFDRAWHPAIIANLIDKGMPPLYVHLIANYLTNRTISVSYGGGTATKTLTLSTPQGAVLSPFLWNLFIDTLLLDIEKTFPDVRISAWADDVILAFNYRYINPQIAKNKLHDISKTLKQWSDRNKATFAPNKSEVLAVRNLYNHTSLLTCDTLIGQIKGVTTLKILGVTFDEALTFIPHVTSLSSKVSKTIFSLRNAARRCWKISNKYFMQIFVGAILPKLF